MNSKNLKIDIRILLPEAPDEKDSCIQRLITALEGKAGIGKAHVVSNEAGAHLCIHYDADGIPLSRVEEIAKAEGAIITERIGHASFEISPPRHARHADLIKRNIAALKGVLNAGVSLNGNVFVEFDQHLNSVSDIKSKIGKMTARPTEHEHVHEEGESAHKHGPFGFGERAELHFSIAAAAFLGIGYGLGTFADFDQPFARMFYVGSYIFGGFFTSIEAIENLKKKRFEIDTLMLVAAIGAVFLNKWAEGALLLTLFSLGHALEHYAMGRAKRAIEALAELAPKTALVFRNNETLEIAVSEIEIGDRVLIKPNERIPIDGYVVRGSSSVNQAPVTGESVPVDKHPVESADLASQHPEKVAAENRIFTGTINGGGAIEAIATKLSNESTLARIVKLVGEAEAEASPTERFTKKLEKYFVPTVLFLVTLLLFAFVVIDESFSESFYRAMAVLVASSPCALAISTPSAVLSGIARAGRSGVLVKSGAALEHFGRLRAIAFDKTGTLTEGKPEVSDIFPLNGISENELLRVAAAVEKSSDHPLAQAIVNHAKKLEIPIPAAANVKSLTGKGIQAEVENNFILVGKPGIFTIETIRSSIAEPVELLQNEGRTVVVVASGEKALGVFGVMDTPRQSSKPTLAKLVASGVTKLVMLSGDHQKVADAVAKQTGLTDAYGNLMPDDKVQAIRALREKFGMVAMVGDGVNDAPAMAAATVGVAMGAAGSDVALETADIALMTNDLDQLVFSVRLSRKASRIIRQNLWISIGVVIILIPATLLGLGIGPAVVAHEGSTLVVVFNALRLLMYEGDS